MPMSEVSSPRSPSLPFDSNSSYPVGVAVVYAELVVGSYMNMYCLSSCS